MKINQIVTEHKKGVKAMKYTKKTKSTVPLYGPDKQEAKLTPVKPIKPVKTVSEDAPIGVELLDAGAYWSPEYGWYIFT